MDSNRFDRLAKSLGQRRSRRQALAAGALGMAAVPLAHASHGLAAQDATPQAAPGTDVSHPAFLFVQLADAGTWLPNPDDEGGYLLTLSDAGSQTLYFSDRPERVVGTVTTDQFLEGLGFSPYQPPNAAVVVQTADGTRDVLVVELFNPVYTQAFGENDTNVLTYEARVLDAYQGEGLEEWAPQADDDQLPREFTNISLFIDDCTAVYQCMLTAFGGLGGPYAYVGTIPGGPYPRCWSSTSRTCLHCDARTIDEHVKINKQLADLCNRAYPRCNNRCALDVY